MARAYAYANGGGPIPNEIRLANLVQEFGADSIYGRPLGANEITKMEIARSVVNLYSEREASGEWASWAAGNPQGADFLNYAMKQAIDLGMIDDISRD